MHRCGATAPNVWHKSDNGLRVHRNRPRLSAHLLPVTDGSMPNGSSNLPHSGDGQEASRSPTTRPTAPLSDKLLRTPGLSVELTSMTGWEYRKIDLNDLPRETSDLDLLDKAGDDGWELVVITVNFVAYLKRPISKPRSRQKR